MTPSRTAGPAPLRRRLKRAIVETRAGRTVDLAGLRAAIAEHVAAEPPVDIDRLDPGRRELLQRIRLAFDEYARCVDLIEAGDLDAAEASRTRAVRLLTDLRPR